MRQEKNQKKGSSGSRLGKKSAILMFNSDVGRN
jgi:hypothetical protein